jgi:hypothetical protein
MITEFFITLGLSIVGWVGSLFQPFVLPSWLTSSSSGLYGFLNTAAGLGVWLPMSALGISIGFLGVCFGAMLATKLILRVWSMLPFIGGGGG